MKTFALIFTLAAFMSLICGSSSDDKGALEGAFEYLTESIKSVSGSKSYGKYINKIDFECAKESLNLSQNGHKLVNEVQGIITAVAAYVQCLRTNEEETLDFATKLVIEEYGIRDVESLDFESAFNTCFKLKLLQIEPTSRLLANFTAATTEQLELCEILSIDELTDHTVKPIEEQIGPLDTATCGAVDNDLVANFLIKFNLVPAVKRKDVEKEETQKMVDLFRAKITATSDCILKSI